MTGNEKSSSGTSSLSANVIGLRSTLCLTIDCGHGLLDALRSMEVLTDRQIQEINSKPTDYNSVSVLLDFIVQLTHKQQRQFLIALFKTQQVHVNNLIVSNGTRPSDENEPWPLFGRDQFHRIEKNLSQLTELIDSTNGLLEELLAVKCINLQHRQHIESQNSYVKINTLLLDIMKKRSISDYYNFISSLEKTKQYHVISLLEPHLAPANCRPLSEKLKEKILVNLPELTDLLDTKGDLLIHLVAADCITLRQKDSIESVAPGSQRNSRLLEILMRGSESDFQKFIDCLIKSGQQHVSRILQEHGVVAHLVAKLDTGNRLDTRTVLYRRTKLYGRRLRTNSIKEDEAIIVQQFMNLLKNSSFRHAKQLLSKAVNVVQGVQLIAVSTHCSIGLYYLCTSSTGLSRLTELHSSGQLQLWLNQVFTALLQDGRQVIIKSLMWNMSNYIRCSYFIFQSEDMPILSHIYSLAGKRSNVDNSYTCSLGLSFNDMLPFDVTEKVLMRASVELFVSLSLRVTRAEVYTGATLCSVCHVWWRRLTDRRFVKRRLRQQFRQICRPFKRCPQQLANVICVERNVWGIAEFINKLYVVCERSNTLTVFDSSPPFDVLENIVLHEMLYPVDIVVCSDTSQLYIADYAPCTILRVNLLSYKQVDKFILTQWPPFSLSTRYRRLLITPWDGDALFIYGDDGVLLKQIKLPDYIWATHAVETTHNTYIVSHRSRLTDDPLKSEHESVSEIDINGRVVRRFNNQHNDIGSIQFNRPYYVALAGNNHVTVADLGNERIIVLDEDLKSKRVLINSPDGQKPFRLCLSERTGLLFVSMYGSEYIYVEDVVEAKNFVE